jgi:hypothetical protein
VPLRSLLSDSAEVSLRTRCSLGSTRLLHFLTVKGKWERARTSATEPIAHGVKFSAAMEPNYVSSWSTRHKLIEVKSTSASLSLGFMLLLVTKKAVTRSHLPVGVRRLHSAAYDQTAI